jgi:hypothetical protein
MNLYGAVADWQSPGMAVHNVDQWMAIIMEERKKGKNVIFQYDWPYSLVT